MELSGMRTVNLNGRGGKRIRYENDREDGSANEYMEHMAQRTQQYRYEMQALTTGPAHSGIAQQCLGSSTHRRPLLLHDAEISGLVAHYLRWNARVRQEMDSSSQINW